MNAQEVILNNNPDLSLSGGNRRNKTFMTHITLMQGHINTLWPHGGAVYSLCTDLMSIQPVLQGQMAPLKWSIANKSNCKLYLMH